jgi:hypothetical protein
MNRLRDTRLMCHTIVCGECTAPQIHAVVIRLGYMNAADENAGTNIHNILVGKPHDKYQTKRK